MASLNKTYWTEEKALQLLEEIRKRGGSLQLVSSVADEVNQYNQNVGMYIDQTKEERDRGDRRIYLANGRTVWTNGTAVAFDYVAKDEQPQQAEPVPQSNIGRWHSAKGVEEVAENVDDLPF